jgi:general secretion pathway protein I
MHHLSALAQRSTARKQQGMTLIEVMVALAIFAVAALSIVSMTGEHIRSLSYLEQKNMGLWIANNHLTQVNLDNKFPALGTKNGKLDYAGITWFWQQKVVKTADPQFRSINIRILTEEKSDYAVAELTTYMVAKK